MNIGLRYDFRTLSDEARSDRYRAALDQCEWADLVGFDYVRLNEHHGAEDGYLPSPLVMAAAIGARTRRMRIRTSLVVLPLHDPVRIAEDAAVADLVCGGRLELAVGAGYIPREFAMFGFSIDERVSRLEDGISVLRKAWTGEPFAHRGATVRVTPRPTNGTIPLYLGGTTKGAARRAARLADGFEPSTADLGAHYVRERERIGRTDGDPLARPTSAGAVRFLHVAEDPEAAWRVLGPHALHESSSYARWATEHASSTVAYPPIESVEELRRTGTYAVMTPEGCLGHARGLGPADPLEFHPMMGGMPIDLGWDSLELFARHVYPTLRPPS